MIYYLVALLFLGELFIFFKIGVFSLPKIKKPYYLVAKPINPNTAIRECQFCGKKPAQKSRDGYYACNSCTVLRLNQVPDAHSA
jgi:hypothetical protein